MRLIDVDALYDEIFKWIPKGAEITDKDLSNVLMAIEKAPTIDAEPVVRCKDCKFFIANKDSHFGLCEMINDGDTWCDYDTCSYAVRKDGE